MDEKLKLLLNRLDEIESRFGDSEKLKITVRQALDSTEHTRKIDTIINILIFVAVIVVIFGIGNLLLLWGLAK